MVTPYQIKAGERAGRTIRPEDSSLDTVVLIGRRCPTCQGDGEAWDFAARRPVVPCPSCLGAGWLPAPIEPVALAAD